MITEKSKQTLNGIPVLFVFLFIEAAIIYGFVHALIPRPSPVALLYLLAFIFVLIVAAMSFFRVQPNQAAALTLFGKYVGSTRRAGLHFANPFFSKKRISLRVRNFQSDTLKVNDLSGSPIEIAAVVVWQVADSAQALFGVDDYQEFVAIQSEAALRQMASSYPYDGEGLEEGEITLRGHADEVSAHLLKEIKERLHNAGVEVMETRITHLAYAPEIAGAMLQRQQAGAIIAARTRIVEGAVSMVEMALKRLEEGAAVELDDERRASMVSNLMVVLCSDRAPQPVVNTGSIY